MDISHTDIFVSWLKILTVHSINRKGVSIEACVVI